jgi:hypothetical protein
MNRYPKNTCKRAEVRIQDLVWLRYSDWPSGHAPAFEIYGYGFESNSGGRGE